MKALRIEKPGFAKIVEVEKPGLEDPEDVILRIEGCGICGTDLHIFKGLEFARYPVVPGHEFVGEIVALGDRARQKFNVGNRIVGDPNLSCYQCENCRKGLINMCTGGMINQGVNINGAFAEYTKVNMKQCYKISGEIPISITVLGEPLSCILHALSKVKIDADKSVLIVGGGSIGVLIYKLLTVIQGLRHVDIVEIDENRIQAAKKADVDRIYKAIPEYSAYDYCFEASGSPKAFEEAIKSLKAMGTLIQFGVADENTRAGVPMYDIYRKELNIIGSFVNPFTMGKAVEMLENYHDVFCGIVGKTFSLEDTKKVLEGKIDIKKYLKTMGKLQ
ncbi:MAG: alcohol dehydrogenase catalytic domain-containing protein [Petrotogales bacterium]